MKIFICDYSFHLNYYLIIDDGSCFLFTSNYISYDPTILCRLFKVIYKIICIFLRNCFKIKFYLPNKSPPLVLGAILCDVSKLRASVISKLRVYFITGNE